MKKFRKILEARQNNGESGFYSIFLEMEKSAVKKVFPLYKISPTNSYTGIQHSNNVEENIDNMISDEVKESFSSSEIYILLSAILYHDIGKIKGKGNHTQVSCCNIQEKWHDLGIIDYDYSLWISIVSCSHGWNDISLSDCQTCKRYSCFYKETYFPKKKPSVPINFLPESIDGPVRILWLVTLLKLGDELDHIKSRIVVSFLNQFVKGTSSNNNSWRRNISSIRFDVSGKCIKLCSNIPLETWIEKKDELSYCQDSILRINNILNNWRSFLLELGLDYKEAFLEVSSNSAKLYSFDGIGKSPTTAIEPIFKESGLLHVVETAIDILGDNVINKEYFTFSMLCAEAGIADIPLIKLALSRILSNKQKNITVFSDGFSFTNRPLLKSKKSYNIQNKYKPTIIHTGIRELDILLSPESPFKSNSEEWLGGFYAPNSTFTTSASIKKHKWLVPIISIEASSGRGKTTLCLQIANGLIKDNWTCFYYSLEQQPNYLIQALEGYNFFEDENVDTSSYPTQFILNSHEKQWYKISKNDLAQKIILPGLTSNITDEVKIRDEKIFEDRYKQLEKTIIWYKEITKTQCKCFFIIDSLSTFCNAPLSRIHLNNLFNLFRRHEIPLLVTLERKQNSFKTDDVFFNEAKYLSDIIINLEYSIKESYTGHLIEINKTRYNRHILGKHSYKIKSPFHKSTKVFDDRCGFVIYPSTHFRLSPQLKSQVYLNQTEEKLLIKENVLPIGNTRKERDKIFSDTITVISGPFGGHKFALGLNILLSRCYNDKNKSRKLIISLAEEQQINLNQSALISSVGSEWRDLLFNIDDQNSNIIRDSKLWEFNYGKKDSKIQTVTVLNFRMGNILPEEFLYIIDKYLEDSRKRESIPIDSVLFADTAQMRTRFPLLAQDKLFLPSLVDILKSQGLFTVFIDIPENKNYHEALLAAADCRIFTKEKRNCVEINLNNVRGKKYNNGQWKMSILNANTDKPELQILNDNELIDNKNEK